MRKRFNIEGSAFSGRLRLKTTQKTLEVPFTSMDRLYAVLEKCQTIIRNSCKNTDCAARVIGHRAASQLWVQAECTDGTETCLLQDATHATEDISSSNSDNVVE